jgi:hypothetical protein
MACKTSWSKRKRNAKTFRCEIHATRVRISGEFEKPHNKPADCTSEYHFHRPDKCPPARAHAHVNVSTLIGLTSVYIHIYVYIRICAGHGCGWRGAHGQSQETRCCSGGPVRESRCANTWLQIQLFVCAHILHTGALHAHAHIYTHTYTYIYTHTYIYISEVSVYRDSLMRRIFHALQTQDMTH